MAVYNRAQVEQVLGWALGSIDAILAGGDPTPLDQQVRVPALPTDLAAEIERIKSLPLPVEDRLAMLRALIDLHAEALAAQPNRRAG